eukprot:Phypoly_transcript_10451.p1 GENE.Phypoly_transcript_10451~~Phypoly_transcript_10451.p1  ORF type:complete len:113 (+),score=8.30 Phypoly_transcript_10451:713-1051(+)
MTFRIRRAWGNSDHRFEFYSVSQQKYLWVSQGWNNGDVVFAKDRITPEAQWMLQEGPKENGIPTYYMYGLDYTTTSGGAWHIIPDYKWRQVGLDKDGELHRNGSTVFRVQFW